ncbi:MAG TPA: 3-carboxy-cis,cis-muconate cycloisomerase [Acidimicrobiales bacterium]|nr:3-carboxy-cis,cis-muconate cycloisomerase [Acidimicrobiales bacterium]
MKLSSSTADEQNGGGLFTSIFTTDELAGLSSDAAWIQAMLQAEVALAQAEATIGLVPPGAAEDIAAGAATGRFDPVAVGRAARSSGNPVVPLVEALRASVAEESAQWVHWGATSQDILDTAAMLVIRRSTSVIGRHLATLADGCAGLTRLHRHTLTVGRSLLPPALPTTFGLKTAGWLTAVDRARRQLATSVEGLSLQFGGAAGTLASLGEEGPAVLSAMAENLSLVEPVLPWHTHRQQVAEVAGALAVVAGTVNKITYDIALLMQAEVAEVSERGGNGRGGSSTLPQKHNPVSASIVGGASRRVTALVTVIYGSLAQEHERAVGAWHAEWATLTELLRLSGGAAANTAECIAGLSVFPEAMASNLAAAGQDLLAERVIMELTRKAGRASAVAVVADALAAAGSGPTFAESLQAAGATAWISSAEIDALVDPSTYLGSSDVFIDRALAAHESFESG